MEKWLQVHGREWFYRDIGEGKPLLLLHGFCEFSMVWDPVLILLDDRYRLIIPDLPGSGRSPVGASWTMHDLAADLLVLLDQEGLDEVVVMGHSMGGYLAMEMLAGYPERLTGIGLIHSHVYADTEEKKESRRKAIRFVGENGARAYVRQLVPGLFAPLTDRVLVRAEIDALDDQDPEGLQQALEAMINRLSTEDVLQNAHLPVLMVQGHHDTLLPMENLLAQAALAPQTELYVLPQAGHMGMLEQPREMAGHINDYLSRFIS
ncbi:MAG: alpha/beta hydrolase [Chitinophagales bacterium]|nr:alpha/beta hydrolase [Chitinophagales bacterium]MCB9021461.1 alpha/beta hydrolase [Chitinophagales bacterium]MCB9032022.1 alpha/beta hydrolase [Chitinophagales bacterium]HPE98341.1 alpha/beta hydrolase [Chitinophagales bacterium]HPR28476.1 alpha/beta hydrolase [Chitinophagales bacterium]